MMIRTVVRRQAPRKLMSTSEAIRSSSDRIDNYDEKRRSTMMVWSATFCSSARPTFLTPQVVSSPRCFGSNLNNYQQRAFSGSDNASEDSDSESQCVTTESGLQYEDEVVGEGKTPCVGDTVRVHYTGTLQDGTQFDTSRELGIPIDFPIGEGKVIAGWDEGILTMKVGGKRKLVIPSELAYGDDGMGDIPGCATLFFDCELIKIEDAPVGVLAKIRAALGV